MNYRVGSHPGCPSRHLMHQSTKQDPGQGRRSMCLTCGTIEKDPRQGSPCKYLNGQSYRQRLARRPSDGQLQEVPKKDSDGALTPTAGAVHVPAYLAPPGYPQVRQLCQFHPQPSWGRAATGKKSRTSMQHRVTSVMSNSLRPCRLWPAGLLCQGVSPGKNTGMYWPCPSRALYFLLP